MSEWVVMQCLMHLRQHSTYARQRAKQLWAPLTQPEASEVTVGIMGLGVLGQDAVAQAQGHGLQRHRLVASAQADRRCRNL